MPYATCHSATGFTLPSGSIPLKKLLICFAVALITAGCDSSSDDSASSPGTISSALSATSDYGALCDIYEEVIPMDLATFEKTTLILDRVEDELPAIYQQYEEMLLTGGEDGYELLRKSAELETGKAWECPQILSLHTGTL